MLKTIFAALIVALPGLALAQSTPNNSRSQSIPNQTNLQDQANESSQPRNAGPSSGAGLGSAGTIPTPTLHRGMSQNPAQSTTPH